MKDEIIKMLDELEVDLVESDSFEYDKGWAACNLTWDLRIIDLQKKIKKLASLK
jgi:hypothetical protein